MAKFDFDWIWPNMTEYYQIWLKMARYNWIQLNMTEYDYDWLRQMMTENDWIWPNTIGYDWIWLSMTECDYDWIWLYTTEYDQIWLNMTEFDRIWIWLNDKIKWDSIISDWMTDQTQYRRDQEKNHKIIPQFNSFGTWSAFVVTTCFLASPKCPPDSWATQTYGQGPAGTLT